MKLLKIPEMQLIVDIKMHYRSGEIFHHAQKKQDTCYPYVTMLK